MVTFLPDQDSWSDAILMATVAGAIWHYCSHNPVKLTLLTRAMVASALCGLVGLLVCEWRNIMPPMRYLVILCMGMHGMRFLNEITLLIRYRLGLVEAKPLEDAATKEAEEDGKE